MQPHKPAPPNRRPCLRTHLLCSTPAFVSCVATYLLAESLQSASSGHRPGEMTAHNIRSGEMTDVYVTESRTGFHICRNGNCCLQMNLFSESCNCIKIFPKISFFVHCICCSWDRNCDA